MKNEIVKKAKNYVDEHKKCVKMAYVKLMPFLTREFNLTEQQLNELEVQIKEHDNSKYKMDELVPYANYFFKKKTDEDITAFKVASELHKSRNAHHPEFWAGKDMPLNFIIEMVCDWWAFIIAQNNLTKTLTWYELNKQKLNLSKNTTENVEKILNLYFPKKISKMLDN